MFGLSYASVPLYRIFCQTTGYGGSLKTHATSAIERPIDRFIKIGFNADTDKNLAWEFVPLQKEILVQVGKRAIAFYKIRNKLDVSIRGMAVYNVTPSAMAPYFEKIECFCFIEQELLPHQEIIAPVTFMISSDIQNNDLLKDLDAMTLSYTFFKQ